MRRFKELLSKVGYHIFGTKHARAVIVSLAAVVVFVTTYLLILPALTLDEDEAQRQGGISLTTEAPAEEAAQGAEVTPTEDQTAPSYKSGELAYEGKSFGVEATVAENAKLPTDTQLKVKEIEKDSDDYAEYYKEALKAVKEDADTQASDLSYAKFYDIALRSDGKNVEPADTVNVTISYDKGLAAKDADHVRIIHFKEDPKTEKVEAEILKSDDVDVTIEKNKMTEAAFKAESFSVYAVVYTVDFEYTDEKTGEVYQYSMDGGKSMKLSELFEAVGIKKDIKEVANVTFSDTSLVTVTKNDILGDWVLQSLKAFDTDETLTVVMKDGKQIVIKVTDSVSDNMSATLATATIMIDGEEDTDNNWSVIAGQPYQVHLTFAEVPGGNQFPDDGGNLVYKLPDSFNVPDSTSGNIDFTYDTGSGIATITGSTYRYDPESGCIIITLSDEAINKIHDSGNARFTIDIDGYFDGTSTHIDWSEDVQKDLDIVTDNDLSITKDGYYSAADGKVYYTVRVTSTGVSTGISVTDVISGSALTMDEGSVQVSGNTGTVNTTYDSNGFTTAIDKMYDGEVVTITYTASVDHAKLEGKTQETITASDTGNTVTVTGNDDDQDEASKVIVDNFDTVSISKSAGNAITVGNTSTIPWTITYNANQVEPVGGAIINDTITGSAASRTSYSGDGIIVQIYDGNTLVDTITRTWEDLGVTSSSKTWSYTLPADDHAYKYVISYTTETDVSGQLAGETVNNSVVDDDGHDSSSSGQTKPGEDGITITKTHSSVTAQTITWNVTFNVPKSGLNTAVVSDTLPTVESFQDTINPDNISVTGLLEEESYTVDTSMSTMVVITFYQDEQQTIPGLKGSENSREIVVTLTTDNDAEWVQTYSDGTTWHSYHTNRVSLNADDNVFTAEDSAVPITSGIQKTGSPAGYVRIGDVDYPIFKYTIDIFGWTEGSFPYTITDTFDTRYLRFYDYWNSEEPTPTGADPYTGALKIDWYGGSYTGVEKNGEKLHFSETDTGFSVTINSSNVAADNIAKPHRIIYYLIVKDEAALNSLLAQSLDASDQDYAVPLSNTAAHGDSTSSQTVEYQYPAVDKTLLGVDPDSRIATYKIVLNPSKVQLNGGDTITMTDTYENLSVDFSSVRVTLEDKDGTVYGPYNTSSDQDMVTWNYRGNTGTFNIPDETKVTITYSARVTKEGAVTISNTASMLGFKDSVVEDTYINSTGSGSLDLNYIWLFKHEGGNMNNPITGVEFTLVDANGNPILYPSTAHNGKAGQPITFTTETRVTDDGAQLTGYAQINLSEGEDGISFQKGVKYYLKETKAAEGYQKIDTLYSFTIANHPDYNKYEYHIGDVLRVNNWPQEGVIKIRKTFVGAENLTDTQKKQITFTLSGTPADGTTFETKTFSYNEFTSGAYTFEQLAPGEYTVTETGYEIGRYHYDGTTTTAVNGTAYGNARSASFTITQNDIDNNKVFEAKFENRYSTPIPTSLTVIKTNPAKDVHLYNATFQILKKVNNAYVPLEEAEAAQNPGLGRDSTFTIDYENREKGVTITQLGNGEYKLIELTAPAGYIKTDAEMTFTVTNGAFEYTDTSTQLWTQIVSREGDAFTLEVTVPNELDHSYKFTKVAVGNLDAYLIGAEFTVYEYTASGEATELFTLTTDRKGQFVIDDRNPAQSQYLSLGHAYYVVETKAPVGYELPTSPTKYFFYYGSLPSGISPATLTVLGKGPYNLSNGSRQEVLENEKKTTEISVKKLWNGSNTVDESFTEIQFKLLQEVWKNGELVRTSQYPDSNTLYTITKAQWEAWQALSIADLPTGDSINGEVVTYKYSVEEVPVEGYKAYYTNNSAVSGVIEINNKPTPVKVSVNKVWVDGESSHNPIQVELIAYDQDDNRQWNPSMISGYDQNNFKQELNSNNGWTYTWTDLNPAYSYYAVETNVPSGYTVTYSADRDHMIRSGAITITNSKLTEGVAVKKKWINEDGNNPDDSQIAPITVELYRQKAMLDGCVVTIQLVNDNGNIGNAFSYSVARGGTLTIKAPPHQAWPNPGHTSFTGSAESHYSKDLTDNDTYQLTNIQSDISLTFDRGWAGDTNSIQYIVSSEPTMTLIDGTKGLYDTVELNNTNNWYKEWTGLDTTSDDGYQWVYSVKETSVHGYITSYENNDGIQNGTIIITNQKQQSTDFSFTKLWKNDSGGIAGWPSDVSSIEVTLKRKNGDEEDPNFSKTFTLTDSDEGGTVDGITWTREYNSTTKNYTFTFSPLDSGYTYYVAESSLEGYSTSYADVNKNTLINVNYALDGQYIINTPDSAYELPSTGGPGTTLTYILGIILTVGAGVLLLLRRRKTAL